MDSFNKKHSLRSGRIEKSQNEVLVELHENIGIKKNTKTKSNVVPICIDKVQNSENADEMPQKLQSDITSREKEVICSNTTNVTTKDSERIVHDSFVGQKKKELMTIEDAIKEEKNYNLDEFKISSNESERKKDDYISEKGCQEHKTPEGAEEKNEIKQGAASVMNDVVTNLDLVNSDTPEKDIVSDETKNETTESEMEVSKGTQSEYEPSDNISLCKNAFKRKKETETKRCRKREKSFPKIKKSPSEEIVSLSSDDEMPSIKSNEKDALPKQGEENEGNNIPSGKEDTSLYSAFEITIPLVGKKVIQNDETPLTGHYDLAIEMNRKRFRFMKKEGLDNYGTYLRPWEIEAKMSEKEKKKLAIRKKRRSLTIARNISEIGFKILQELNSDSIKEKELGKHITKFLQASVTPTSLLYVPHLVHTIAFCRGYRGFSKHIRMLADECYRRCHAMFPVPLGYNFETVYTSEVRKFLTDPLDRLDDMPLDYGDTSDIPESSDSENNSGNEGA